MERAKAADVQRVALGRTAAGKPPPCWLRDAAKGQTYLPECTADGCAEYPTLELAAGACEVLAEWGAGCAGVTARGALRSFQTRASAAARRSPHADEKAWLRRPCAVEIDPDDACAVCGALVHQVAKVIGSKRWTEVEVVDALEGACAPLRRRSDDLGRACDGFVDKHGAEEIEAAMLRAPGDAKAVCVGAAAVCAAGAEVPTGEAPGPAEAPAEMATTTKGRKTKRRKAKE